MWNLKCLQNKCSSKLVHTVREEVWVCSFKIKVLQCKRHGREVKPDVNIQKRISCWSLKLMNLPVNGLMVWNQKGNISQKHFSFSAETNNFLTFIFHLNVPATGSVELLPNTDLFICSSVRLTLAVFFQCLLFLLLMNKTPGVLRIH